jgi:hypothetical protein
MKDKLKNGPYYFVRPPAEYPGKRYRDKYAYEHHVVWWAKNGLIPRGHEIHHMNGNHRDNRIENLQLVSSKEHRKIHADLSRKPPLANECNYCGVTHYIPGRNYRYKIKHGQKYFFCSTLCQAKLQHQLGGRLR